MYKETFASKIRKARHDTGFSLRDVAKETNIPYSTISKYETGKLEPDLEKLGILIDFYNIPANWLLGTRNPN
jgi:transcriptional regulator with XRE-family HTH domain